ncbi:MULTISPECIES: DUF502 domain-containing protein [Methylomonas]|uniref:DUF502 domain-containing protein n=1 Tax=Methylomonas TaxID=416 RepID=UPI0006D1D298|nr:MULTISPECIES: DUF502 domain-containing protein [Methylomonas]ANE56615.1 hypothetical protein AYM39_16495 [Methylomonas sp. DH-1]BBL59774.1 membrane protein [Methylomonas koyamae]
MSQQPNSQTLIRQSLALVKTSFNHVLIGILAVLPVYIVVQIFVWLVDFVLQTVFDIRGWIGHYWLAAVVFAAVYALLAYIGNEIAKHRQSLVISIFDMLIERVPFLRGVYRVSKKVIEMFRGQGDNRIREVVYVEYPKDGVWVPAYVTNREGNRYVLYIPTSPNPTNGFTVIVDESKVVKSELNLEDVTSFVVSIGSDFPKSHESLSLPR